MSAADLDRMRANLCAADGCVAALILGYGGEPVRPIATAMTDLQTLITVEQTRLGRTLSGGGA